jgi:hypothetical protein
VKIVNASRDWYERGRAVERNSSSLGETRRAA